MEEIIEYQKSEIKKNIIQMNNSAEDYLSLKERA